MTERMHYAPGAFCWVGLATSDHDKLGLARTFKNEIVQIAPNGRVNVVAPGWTVTPAAEASLSDQVIEAATMTMPLKKVATPEEIARAIVWLASPVASGHCSGQILEVAGGMEGRVVSVAA